MKHIIFFSKLFLYFEAIVELYSVRFRLKPKIRCYYRHNHRNNGTKKKRTRIEPLVKRKRENSSSKFLSLSFFDLALFVSLFSWLRLHRASNTMANCGFPQHLVIQPQLGVLTENENTSAVCYYKSALIENRKETELAKGPRLGLSLCCNPTKWRRRYRLW